MSCPRQPLPGPNFEQRVALYPTGRTALRIQTDPIMNLISRRTLAISLIALTLAAPSFTHAASGPGAASSNVASTSAVRGRIQNVVTGKYLNNARVAVKGTQITALTDETGAYHLVNVPSGPIVLEVFYTDLDRRYFRMLWTES